MPSFTATAPGKVILFGEHAVVYGQPAIAVPVSRVWVKTIVTPDIHKISKKGRVKAPQIDLNANMEDLPENHPIAIIIDELIHALGITNIPKFILKINSTIPVAAGLGSGAAVSVAVIRAMSAFLGCPLSNEKINELAYSVEKIHHGTPSGIDNTVITYQKPVYFVKEQPIEFIRVMNPFTIVIADTGISSPTATTVAAVRQARDSDLTRYDNMFNEIGGIVRQARRYIELGEVEELGSLMDQNHHLLKDINVSSPELETLISTARDAGAKGAKLSGGGRGGNMIAFTAPEKANMIAEALQQSGATHTFVTTIR